MNYNYYLIFFILSLTLGILLPLVLTKNNTLNLKYSLKTSYTVWPNSIWSKQMVKGFELGQYSFCPEGNVILEYIDENGTTQTLPEIPRSQIFSLPGSYPVSSEGDNNHSYIILNHSMTNYCCSIPASQSPEGFIFQIQIIIPPNTIYFASLDWYFQQDGEITISKGNCGITQCPAVSTYGIIGDMNRYVSYSYASPNMLLARVKSNLPQPLGLHEGYDECDVISLSSTYMTGYCQNVKPQAFINCTNATLTLYVISGDDEIEQELNPGELFVSLTNNMAGPEGKNLYRSIVQN